MPVLRLRLCRDLALATVGFGLAFYLVGAAIKPGYSHCGNYISELNATGTAWAFALSWFGFVPLGLLFGAFLVALAPLRQLEAAVQGYWLLWSQPVAFVGVALFPCDPGCPAGGSVNQIAHNLLALVTYFAGALALVLLAKTARRLGDPLSARILAGSGAALMVLFVVMLTPEVDAVRGLLQRLGDASLGVCVVVLGTRVARLVNSAG